MPRIRNIKPSFFTDADLGELSPLHRLLFAGLWCQADKTGRLEDKPRELKVQIFPYDECDIDSMLWDLAERDFIGRYEAEHKDDVRRFITIWNFEEHQRVHKEEKSCGFPSPGDGRLLSREIARDRAKSPVEDVDKGAAPSPFQASSVQPPSPALKKNREPAESAHTKPVEVGREGPPPETEPTFKADQPTPLDVVIDAYERVRGRRPSWGPAHERALAPISHHPLEEIGEVAERAFRATTYPKVANPYDLAKFWDHYAGNVPTQAATGPPVLKRPATDAACALCGQEAVGRVWEQALCASCTGLWHEDDPPKTVTDMRLWVEARRQKGTAA